MPRFSASRPRLLASLMYLVSCVGLMSPAWGQQEQPEDSSVEVELATQMIMDLGHIEVENVEPIRNQTEKISVQIRLVLAESADEKVLASLEHWRHRLRDQVIIAIRSCNTSDFLEPELHRLRSQIQYRLKRTLKSRLVEDVLLADYSFAIK